MPDQPTTRRDFLGRTAAGVAAISIPGTLGASAAKPNRVIGANDRINIGMIGVGGRGRGHLRHLLERSQEKADVQVVAVCDIYSKRKEMAREMAKLEGKDVHHDYHELLARSDVDAVWISTPDHWHAPQALESLDAGKDVYLEKPMTYTLDEARELAARVKSSGRVLQVGSQHASDKRFHHAKEVIEKGWIGQPVWAQSTYSRNSVHGEWNYRIDEEGTPENIDWDKFLGPAPQRPFSTDRYFRWRKYWDYSGGIATDLFYHRLTPIQLALGPQFPVRVTGQGGIYVHKDREVPDTYSTTVEYESHYTILSSSSASAAGNQGIPTMIYGHEAAIQFLPGAIAVLPERQFKKKFMEAVGQREVVIYVGEQDIGADHIDDFLSCMRTREEPVFDAEFGYKVMTAIALGVESYRKNRLMAFDPKTEMVVAEAPPRPAYEGHGRNVTEPRRG